MCCTSSRSWWQGKVMSAERREQELLRLRALAERSDGKIRLLAAEGSPMHTVRLELRYRTATSVLYPIKGAIDRTELKLSLTGDYPHMPPSATITPTVFNPHVFDSGLICLGSKWIGTEGLDQVVVRVIKIITLHPEVIFSGSPANSGALRWYQINRLLFPTEHLPLVLTTGTPQTKRNLSWKALTAPVPTPAVPATQDNNRNGEKH